jgi:colicin import membrane protein
MIELRTYRLFFFTAVLLHAFIVVMLLWDNQSNDRPAMTLEAKNTAAPSTPSAAPEAIQAVSVDSKEVMAAVHQLKAEREHAVQLEKNRQAALAAQAQMARRQRMEEQQRVVKLKAEAANLALAEKKKRIEEQRKLQELTQQKEAEQKQLAAIQTQQRDIQLKKQQEEKKLADLLAAKAEAHAREVKANEVAQATAQKLAQEAAMQKATADAANRTRIAGVVDKYKALIISAISQQWILPDHADSRLSSQFKIRLAPNGTVLDVSLMRSSGDPVLDRSAQSAIYKASPLPVPADSETFDLFREISLTVRPENAQG